MLVILCVCNFVRVSHVYMTYIYKCYTHVCMYEIYES